MMAWIRRQLRRAWNFLGWVGAVAIFLFFMDMVFNRGCGSSSRQDQVADLQDQVAELQEQLKTAKTSPAVPETPKAPPAAMPEPALPPAPATTAINKAAIEAAKKLLDAGAKPSPKLAPSPKPRADSLPTVQREEELAEKATDLQADIEEAERRIAYVKDGIVVCKEVARMAPCRAVFLQAEKDRKASETALAELKKFLQKKVAELNALSSR